MICAKPFNSDEAIILSLALDDLAMVRRKQRVLYNCTSRPFHRGWTSPIMSCNLYECGVVCVTELPLIIEMDSGFATVKEESSASLCL